MAFGIGRISYFFHLVPSDQNSGSKFELKLQNWAGKIEILLFLYQKLIFFIFQVPTLMYTNVILNNICVYLLFNFYQIFFLFFNWCIKKYQKYGYSKCCNWKINQIISKILFHEKIQTFSYKTRYNPYIISKIPILIFCRAWASQIQSLACSA